MKALSNPGMWIVVGAVLSACAAIAAAIAGWTTLRQQDQQIEILKGWLTGADSYAYFEPLRRGGRLAFFIRQHGNYPTYDVTIRVHEQLANGEDRLIEGPLQLGTLIAGSGMDWTAPESLAFFQDPPPVEAQAREFRIEIQKRNGVIVQRVKLSAVNGRWHTDSKDVVLPNGEHIRPDFAEAQEQ